MYYHSLYHVCIVLLEKRSCEASHVIKIRDCFLQRCICQCVLFTLEARRNWQEQKQAVPTHCVLAERFFFFLSWWKGFVFLNHQPNAYGRSSSLNCSSRNLNLRALKLSHQNWNQISKKHAKLLSLISLNWLPISIMSVKICCLFYIKLNRREVI